MLIDNTKTYDRIWDWVKTELHFYPSARHYKGDHNLETLPPFQVAGDYTVYGIDNMNADQMEYMEDAIRDVFISVTEEGQRLYALDWQHSAFLFDPRKPEEQQSFFVEDFRYWGGGYTAYFPSFYPYGDYYFFIAESLEFGYLGHPWRKEVWVFGEKLIAAFDRIYAELGWDKIK